MDKHTLPNISIIGSGRVAKSLGAFFLSKGVPIKGIYSRNKETGQACAALFKCPFFDKPSELPGDMVLVAVADDQTINIITSIRPEQAVIYTAGSVDLSQIDHPNTGVFYPLQTFSGLDSDSQFDFPVLIEAKTEILVSKIKDLCQYCQLTYDLCNSQKRSNYHLVAVFMNNFINHVGHIAKTENDQRELNWEILKPLLDKTVFNILNNNTLSSQTGPATRNDISIIKKHEEMLDEQHLKVYQALTESIVKTMNSK